jgi:anaerobic ribonucleoside-triphosphate reductase
MSVISSTSSLSYEEFFRYLNNNLESLCKEAHKSIYKEELDRIVCWNISDTVHYLLAKNTNPIVNYKSIGYAEDTNLLMNKYLSDKYLLTIAYDGEGMYTHWFSVISTENYCYIIEYTVSIL